MMNVLEMKGLIRSLHKSKRCFLTQACFWFFLTSLCFSETVEIVFYGTKEPLSVEIPTSDVLVLSSLIKELRSEEKQRNRMELQIVGRSNIHPNFNFSRGGGEIALVQDGKSEVVFFTSCYSPMINRLFETENLKLVRNFQTWLISVLVGRQTVNARDSRGEGDGKTEGASED